MCQAKGHLAATGENMDGLGKSLVRDGLIEEIGQIAPQALPLGEADLKQHIPVRSHHVDCAGTRILAGEIHDDLLRGSTQDEINHFDAQ